MCSYIVFRRDRALAQSIRSDMEDDLLMVWGHRQTKMDQDEAIVVDDDLAGGEKSLANPSSSSTSNSGRATPKLKLTFKLPSPSETVQVLSEEGSNEDASATAAVSSNDAKSKPRGKKSKKKDTAGTNASNEASTGDHSNDELRQFVRKMKTIRCRSWRLDHRVVVPCMALQRTQPFQVTAWVRERSLVPSKPATESSKLDSSAGDTFVCALEGCHKIFDTKLKWKRHQAVHRKRAQKLLALSNTESEAIAP